MFIYLFITPWGKVLPFMHRVNTTDSERFQMFDKSKRRTEKKLTPLK
jgi:hypothetical protein